MQLTDEQLSTLLKLELWNITLTNRYLLGLNTHHPTDTGETIITELIFQGLVVVGVHSKPSIAGEQVLRENALRALTLLQAPSFISGGVRKYIDLLTIEELPVLLTHNNSTVREGAGQRLQELQELEKEKSCPL